MLYCIIQLSWSVITSGINITITMINIFLVDIIVHLQNIYIVYISYINQFCVHE